MKLLTLIQHTSKRPRYLQLVLDQAITGQTEDYSVVTNDINSASGMLECFNEGLSSPDFTHYLVIQDDILPCKDFIKTANHLMNLRPNDFMSLFSASPSVEKALQVNKHWVSLDRCYGLCAYIIPCFMAQDYVDNCVDKIKNDIKADDVKLSIYLAERKFRNYVTAPSLVEHIAWDRSSQHKVHIPQENSILYRIANRYIGFEESGLSIDWTKGLKDPVEMDIGREFDFIRHYKK